MLQQCRYLLQVTLRKTAPFPYASFLDNWDTQDIEFISTMLQTLCDDQVEQAVIGDKKCFFEFHNGHLSYIPLTALMLLKLRDLRGLANPQFSHPAFGDISKLEILHFVLFHTQRHLRQIKLIHEELTTEKS